MTQDAVLLIVKQVQILLFFYGWLRKIRKRSRFHCICTIRISRMFPWEEAGQIPPLSLWLASVQGASMSNSVLLGRETGLSRGATYSILFSSSVYFCCRHCARRRRSRYLAAPSCDCVLPIHTREDGVPPEGHLSQDPATRRQGGAGDCERCILSAWLLNLEATMLPGCSNWLYYICSKYSLFLFLILQFPILVYTQGSRIAFLYTTIVNLRQHTLLAKYRE